jgi:hypothetical protein
MGSAQTSTEETSSSRSSAPRRLLRAFAAQIEAMHRTQLIRVEKIEISWELFEKQVELDLESQYLFNAESGMQAGALGRAV